MEVCEVAVGTRTSRRRRWRWWRMALALDEVWRRVKNVCKQNGLLILSVLAVVIGCLLGFFLRGKQLSEQVSRLRYLGGDREPRPPCPDITLSCHLHTCQSLTSKCPCDDLCVCHKFKLKPCLRHTVSIKRIYKNPLKHQSESRFLQSTTF